ncbi:tetracycline resistance protein [Planoprotostelium fungivorum]|uniref:Tetracycline resistance protein n=1 Tax=Planoprotostelium fungivorum TaxID=1890364 RepID=A0A2P6NBM9_9EUKA|nr:tetracycline resistance protein [Planoprotostelium fungivorum]
MLSRENENKPTITHATMDDRKEGRYRFPRLGYILISIFMFSVSMTMSWGAVPWAMLRLYNDDQGAAGAATGYVFAVMTGAQTFTGPTWGRLSSRFGRKKIMVLSLISAAVDSAIMSFPVSLEVILIVKFICGLLNSYYITIAASVADVTTLEKRALGYSLMWGAFGLTGAGFPMLTGWLVVKKQIDLVFQISACIHLLNMIFILLLSPEFRPEEERISETFEWKELIPFYSFRVLKGRFYVISLCILAFLVAYSFVSLESLTLWCKYRWNWDAYQTGIVNSVIAFVGLIQVPLNAYVVPNMQRGLALFICLCLSLSACFLFVLMENPWLMVPAALFVSIAISANPILQATISKEYTQDRQGDISGVFMCLRGLVWAVGPASNGVLWNAFISPDAKPFVFPGINFAVSGVVIAVSLIGWIIICIIVRHPEETKRIEVSHKEIIHPSQRLSGRPEAQPLVERGRAAVK